MSFASKKFTLNSYNFLFKYDRFNRKGRKEYAMNIISIATFCENISELCGKKIQTINKAKLIFNLIILT